MRSQGHYVIQWVHVRVAMRAILVLVIQISKNFIAISVQILQRCYQDNKEIIFLYESSKLLCLHVAQMQHAVFTESSDISANTLPIIEGINNILYFFIIFIKKKQNFDQLLCKQKPLKQESFYKYVSVVFFLNAKCITGDNGRPFFVSKIFSHIQFLFLQENIESDILKFASMHFEKRTCNFLVKHCFCFYSCWFPARFSQFRICSLDAREMC